MKNTLAGLANLACFILGTLEAEYYFIPLIAFIYTMLWLFLMQGRGQYWLGATVFMLVSLSIWGFVPYFLGQWLFAS